MIEPSDVRVTVDATTDDTEPVPDGSASAIGGRDTITVGSAMPDGAVDAMPTSSPAPTASPAAALAAAYSPDWSAARRPADPMPRLQELADLREAAETEVVRLRQQLASEQSPLQMEISMLRQQLTEARSERPAREESEGTTMPRAPKQPTVHSQLAMSAPHPGALPGRVSSQQFSGARRIRRHRCVPTCGWAATVRAGETEVHAKPPWGGTANQGHQDL